MAALLDDVHATGSLDEGKLRGNFALFLATGERAWLLNDAFGFVRIYACGDGCFYSTSWLAACAYLQHVEIDEASAVEYVLAEAAHSPRTVARGVDVLALGHAHDLKKKSPWNRFPGGFGTNAPGFASPNAAVEAVGEHVRTVAYEVASAFPGKVNAALSGGFDSRLIVAGLLSAGEKPHLFVYGGPGSSDVAIARSVADAIGLDLEVIDKGEVNRGLPSPDLESLEQSAWFFDGLPADGIDDPGADRMTRLQQNAGGRIALNGGGGEIFRNFFHLPDRAFTARDVVKSFYRGFSRGVFRDDDGLANYQAHLAASIRDILGLSRDGDGHLTRAQVELLYPLFRCHYWMGANNSVAVRHGYYATPLVDVEFVRLSQQLPLRWKNAGDFQSRLITAMHTGIAAQPSEYGFSFEAGPDARARLAEWTTCARPAWLRPLVNATRRRLRQVQVAPGLLQRYREILPGEWYMDSLLDLGQLPDGGALGRAMAIEVVFRRIF